MATGKQTDTLKSTRCHRAFIPLQRWVFSKFEHISVFYLLLVVDSKYHSDLETPARYSVDFSSCDSLNPCCTHSRICASGNLGDQLETKSNLTLDHHHHSVFFNNTTVRQIPLQKLLGFMVDIPRLLRSKSNHS